MSTRTSCDICIDVMLSLISFSQWSAYIIVYLNMLYKKKITW